MNLQDMTDAEVYEIGLEILLDELGPAGRLRFLGKCKPCTGDYTIERHEMLRLAKRYQPHLRVRVENPHTWLQEIT